MTPLPSKQAGPRVRGSFPVVTLNEQAVNVIEDWNVMVNDNYLTHFK